MLTTFGKTTTASSSFLPSNFAPVGKSDDPSSVCDVLSDYTEKIRQLELEGTRLRQQVQHFLDDGALTPIDMSEDLQPYDSYPLSHGPVPSETTTMAVSPTCLQHENEFLVPSMKLKHLEESFKEDSNGIGVISSGQQSYNSLLKQPSRLNTARGILASSGYSSGTNMNHGSEKDICLRLPPTLLERELKDAREHADFLRLELRQVHEEHEKERSKLRDQIEDLKSKLYELQRDSEEALKKQESLLTEKDRVIRQLKENLSQLMKMNQQMECTLKESQQRMESFQRNNHNQEDTLEMLRRVLQALERRRGGPIDKKESVEKVTAGTLVHMVDRCLRELEEDTERRGFKIRQLEQELETTKRFSEREKRDLEHECQNRMALEGEKHSQEMQHLQERYDRIVQQEARTHKELDEAREALTLERKTRLEMISQMEDKLSQLQREKSRMEETWRDERRALETSLDHAHRDVAKITAERDIYNGECRALKTKLEHIQTTLSEFEQDVSQVNAEREFYQKQVDELKQRVDTLEKSLAKKRRSLLAFDEAVTALGKCEWSAEHWWRKFGAKPEGCTNTIRHIFTKLTELSKMVHSKDKIIEHCESRLKANQTRIEELEKQATLSSAQLNGAQQEKEHLDKLICSRSAEVERLTAERDYYFKMLDDKTEELAAFKMERHRLTAQITEKINRFKAYATQLESQKSKTEQRMQLDSETLEQTKKRFTQCAQHLKEKERSLKDALMERNNLAMALKETQAKLDSITKAYNALQKELKDYKTQLTKMQKKFNQDEKESKTQWELQKEIVNLTEQLKSAKKELHSARGTLKQFSGEGSTEVDAISLTSVKERIEEMERHMEAALKDKENLREENDRLVALLERASQQNERLSKEFEHNFAHNEELRDRLQQSTWAKEQAKVCRSILQNRLAELHTEMSHRAPMQVEESVVSPAGQSGDNAVKPVIHSEPNRNLHFQDLNSMIDDMRELLHPSVDPAVNASFSNATKSVGEPPLIIPRHSKSERHRVEEMSPTRGIPKSKLGLGQSTVETASSKDFMNSLRHRNHPNRQTNNNNNGQHLSSTPRPSRSSSQPPCKSRPQRASRRPQSTGLVTRSLEMGEKEEDSADSLASLTEADRHLSESSLIKRHDLSSSRQSLSPQRGLLTQDGSGWIRESDNVPLQKNFAWSNGASIGLSGRSSPVESLLMLRVDEVDQMTKDIRPSAELLAAVQQHHEILSQPKNVSAKTKKVPQGGDNKSFEKSHRQDNFCPDFNDVDCLQLERQMRELELLGQQLSLNSQHSYQKLM